MSFLRLMVVSFACALFVSACNCSRPPVTTTLKPDGEACAHDEECESSLCDKLPGKSQVCFHKCSQGCKQGDICTALAPNDRFACVTDRPGLCQPCALNIDCPYPGDRCVQLGDSTFCARDCSFDGQCPATYRCADATDVMGAYVTKQCQPTSGTCECTASSSGQTKPCSETNAIGTCNGVQTCHPPNGYDACNAPVPTNEVCNNKDDDCNGMTDENLGDTTCGVGECRRTVSNCANGNVQMCTPGAPSTEICDEKDNNCDGQVDEGFDKMSAEHCGTCNNICTRPHATAACVMNGQCAIGGCDPGWINLDGIDGNGCEYACVITGQEICDGLDNDCDGLTDEGFSTVSDPLNCGLCGRVCNVNNGNINAYQCVASTCGILTCNPGFADCDQSYGTGCEKNVNSDVNNCGNCNVVCTTPNGTPACQLSQCAVGTCNSGWANCNGLVPDGCESNVNSNVDHCGTCPNTCPNRPNSTRTCVVGSCGFTCAPGFTDLDGVAANGCEFGCIAQPGPDVPDDASTDTNCDGIDGDASKAIFVAKTGNDLNPGTRLLPKLTIQAAINAASVVLPNVYISEGTYDESVTMANGVSIYGGYSVSNNWARGAQYPVIIRYGTPTGGRITALTGINITSATTLAYVTVQGRDTNVPGTSVYAMYCITCSGLTIRTATISGGAAGAGSPGTAGAAGAAGGAGSPGNTGTCDANTVGALGGIGGTSQCGRAGGAGGQGGNSPGKHTGASGIVGMNGSSGGPGGGGGDPGGWGGPGANGAPGANGSHGAGGTGGSVVSNLYSASSGANGSNGEDGNGGGGGGGGGSQSCTFCDDGNGNGGGGGGGGGCHGTGGTGGTGGGSSFGLFLVGSTGINLVNCTVTSSNGGTGGSGGQGGAQGPAGSGAGGGMACTSEIGGGGAGGNGGIGGAGGHGGGGAGGASYAIYRVNTNVMMTGGTLSGGLGGLGGTAPAGGNAGLNGPSGAMN
ncbi:MAG: MopE-related protein [Myxococcaceae bacterium]